MAEIKPAEVSAILRQQLSGFKSEAELEEVGTVLQIGDGIARIYGLGGVQYGELIEFDNGLQGIALNLEEDNVGAVLLGASNNIKEGDTVKRTNRIASINVGEKMLGRVVDTLGKPIDGKGPIDGELFEMPIERKAPGVIYRQPVNEPLQTGVKAIDAMIPIGRGQRELVIGDRQTGKTTVCIDTIINQKEFYDRGEPVYCIYVAIGQKGSTIAGIVNKLEEAERGYKKTLELGDSKLNTWLSRGDILIKLGEDEAAKFNFVQALEYHPKSEELEFRLSGVCFKLNNMEAGYAHLLTALHINSEHVFILEELFPEVYNRKAVLQLIENFKNTYK